MSQSYSGLQAGLMFGERLGRFAAPGGQGFQTEIAVALDYGSSFRIRFSPALDSSARNQMFRFLAYLWFARNGCHE